jgi:TetR/AcrR family fatty acid metabolism transcriptional regulator
MAQVLEDKKLLILDAARRLLAARGFQDIALDDIAREAGVAKGTLFLYYKNKDELFTAAYSDFVDRLGRSLEETLATGLKGRSLLEKAVICILSSFEDNKDFMSQFGIGKFPSCGARSCGRLMEKFRENNEKVSRILSAALPHRGAKTKGAAYETLALFGLCRAAMMEKIMSHSDDPLADQAEKVLDFYLKGAGAGR